MRRRKSVTGVLRWFSCFQVFTETHGFVRTLPIFFGAVTAKSDGSLYQRSERLISVTSGSVGVQHNAILPVLSKLKCPVFVASEMSGFKVVPSPLGLGWFWGWGCRGRGQFPFPGPALYWPSPAARHRLRHSDPGSAVRS